MAWIESHQTLAGHPKTRKLAHLLGVSKPTAIGHLHCLWWWALDYAPEGDLSRYDALDIALGAEWEDDAGTLVDALVTVGFLDQDVDGTLVIHDWHDYAGKLIERKKANAERMRKARASGDGPTNAAHDEDVQPRAAHVSSTYENVLSDQTIPNQTIPTEPNQTNNARERAAGANAPDVDVHGQRFASFWSVYPKRVGKGAAEKWWRKRKPSQALTETMIAAVKEQVKSDQWTRDGGQYIPNPSTWLNQERWQDELAPAGTTVTPFSNYRKRDPNDVSASEWLDMVRKDAHR